MSRSGRLRDLRRPSRWRMTLEILGVGPMELLLIFILALIFIGPGKMPEVAASLGKAIREFQRASAELTDALNAEIAAAQAQKAASQLSENGHSQEAEAAEAEVVAQPAEEPMQEEPVTYAGTAAAADTPAEPVSQPEDAGEQPDALATSPSETREAGELYGLEPLPAALLAPSSPDGVSSASAAVPPKPSQAESIPAADGAAQAPEADVPPTPGSHEPAPTPDESRLEVVADTVGQAEV